MTREDINDIINAICPNDEDYEKPCISPKYLRQELEQLALDQKQWNEEPTTKNDLGVDCVARQDVERYIEGFINEYTPKEELEFINLELDGLKHIPSVTPQEPMIVPIAEIKYDADKLKELVNKAVLTVSPQEPRWISVSERLPEEHICDDGFHEPSKSVLVQMKSGTMHTARYWSRYDERWLDLNYPTTDEVIAWMPLPKLYREIKV